MESPHVVIARWIDALISDNKETLDEQRLDAEKPIPVRFVSDEEEAAIVNAMCETALAKERE
jgi:hypothetical protein